MSFIRWYSGPVIAGFLFGGMVNPIWAGIGFLLWLAVVLYVLRRRSGSPQY
ncbi:MAG: hypothetical protein P4N41_05795 [Negativicutes bacterium]|nr:hypothetical protein [Negativicutes bacterium]